MTEFLLKSTLCLLILYLLSWAVTQKSSNFLFIRFLLVASVLFSLILPLVHIETSEMPVSFDQVFNQPFANSTIVENESLGKDSPERWFTSETIFIIIYFGVALIMLMKYLWNIWNLNRLYKLSERMIFKGKRIALIN